MFARPVVMAVPLTQVAMYTPCTVDFTPATVLVIGIWAILLTEEPPSLVAELTMESTSSTVYTADAPADTESVLPVTGSVLASTLMEGATTRAMLSAPAIIF